MYHAIAPTAEKINTSQKISSKFMRWGLTWEYMPDWFAAERSWVQSVERTKLKAIAKIRFMNDTNAKRIVAFM